MPSRRRPAKFCRVKRRAWFRDFGRIVFEILQNKEEAANAHPNRLLRLYGFSERKIHFSDRRRCQKDFCRSETVLGWAEIQWTHHQTPVSICNVQARYRLCAGHELLGWHRANLHSRRVQELLNLFQFNAAASYDALLHIQRRVRH